MALTGCCSVAQVASLSRHEGADTRATLGKRGDIYLNKWWMMFGRWSTAILFLCILTWIADTIPCSHASGTLLSRFM